MFLLEWYKEYIDLKMELAAKKKELQYCEACETLKLQLAIANDERKFLISKLTEKEVEVEKETEPQMFKPIMPARSNWAVRRQQLEAEDRAAAKALAENRKEFGTQNIKVPLSVTEIEKQLGVK